MDHIINMINKIKITKFSDVYVCTQKNKFSTFQCEKFNDYEEANKHYNTTYTMNEPYNHTLMSVCRFMPTFFQNKILQYKLSKLYIKTQLLIK